METRNRVSPLQAAGNLNLTIVLIVLVSFLAPGCGTDPEGVDWAIRTGNPGNPKPMPSNDQPVPESPSGPTEELSAMAALVAYLSENPQWEVELPTRVIIDGLVCPVVDLFFDTDSSKLHVTYLADPEGTHVCYRETVDYLVDGGGVLTTEIFIGSLTCRLVDDELVVEIVQVAREEVFLEDYNPPAQPTVRILVRPQGGAPGQVPRETFSHEGYNPPELPVGGTLPPFQEGAPEDFNPPDSIPSDPGHSAPPPPPPIPDGDFGVEGFAPDTRFLKVKILPEDETGDDRRFLMVDILPEDETGDESGSSSENETEEETEEFPVKKEAR